METIRIDRLEGALAVCEQADGTFAEVPLAQLPADVREGDVLRPADAAADSPAWEIDRAETVRRRAAAQALQDKLFHKSI